MWAAVYWTGGTTDGSMIVYGPFNSEQDADAFIAGQQNPSFFDSVQLFGNGSDSPNPPLSPQSFTALQIVVLCTYYGSSGQINFFLYGPFSSVEAANAWIAGRPYPGPCNVLTVQAAP